MEKLEMSDLMMRVMIMENSYTPLRVLFRPDTSMGPKEVM